MAFCFPLPRLLMFLGVQLLRGILLFAVGLPAACWVLAEESGRGQTANPVRTQKEEVPVIGFVLQELGSSAYQQLEEQAKAYCEEELASGQARCQLISGGALDGRDVAVQKQWFKQLLLKKVNSLVIAPVSTKALIPQLIEARKRGIPVVNIGSRFDLQLLVRNRLQVPWVGPDNAAAARTIASHLAKTLESGDKVIILAGPPGELMSFTRVSSAKKVLGNAGVNVVAVESGQWDSDRAQAVTLRLLDKYSDLKGVFAASDNMALGAMRAGDLKGIKLKVTGFGGDPRLLDYVRTGRILATIDWYPRQQGVYAIDKLLNGSLVDDRMTPWRLIVSSDLKD
ncbi:substrate-binding domain-containing protein [Sansalvadorimonas verongulae]|uniref:substrate-binding domain-containing protein n=1 Tax=Sansalvadorimonas verongulae TaxID=2172824 RepID=UPI0012BD3701|nr:substrate-binding domain-containing protein [Sansalvadorimonas verongulae]MTI13772.1 sugar ABC transporter substrate-binding protein [Sansalvadorimonas verongulae]